MRLLCMSFSMSHEEALPSGMKTLLHHHAPTFADHEKAEPEDAHGAESKRLSLKAPLFWTLAKYDWLFSVPAALYLRWSLRYTDPIKHSTSIAINSIRSKLHCRSDTGHNNGICHVHKQIAKWVERRAGAVFSKALNPKAPGSVLQASVASAHSVKFTCATSRARFTSCMAFDLGASVA